MADDMVLALEARGARFIGKDTDTTAAAVNILRDEAWRGNVLPVMVGDTYGYFVTTDAGYAHVLSVHPDNRADLAWELGGRLLRSFTDPTWRLVRV